MTEDTPHSLLDYKSKEEFQAACHQMAMRMHYLNRVAIGESYFAWEVAEMLSRLGRVFRDYYDDKEVRAAFGDGLSGSPLTSEERTAYLFKLLYEGK